MRIIYLIGVLLAGLTLSACQSTTMSHAEPSKRWVGIMAVKESPLVNQIIAESGNDPAVYYPRLRQLLDAGKIAPAPGRYAFVPVDGGIPTDSPEYFTTKTGVWTMWVPSYMVAPGRAMCVQVPKSWPAIAGQTRYPVGGGKRVNCFDFDERARGSYAATRHTAAMIVVVEPAG